MMADKATALTSERGGRTYYFCSQNCLRTFEDPERELKSMRTRVAIALTGVLTLAILRAGAFIALAAGATLLTWAPIPALSGVVLLLFGVSWWTALTVVLLLACPAAMATAAYVGFQPFRDVPGLHRDQHKRGH